MNKLTKAITYALLGLVCFGILVKIADFIKQSDTQNTPATSTSQLKMEWSEVVAEGVSSDEADRIEEFIDTFESALAQRDSDKALSFFSAPESEEEQGELEFILGEDLATESGPTPFTRLFRTAGYNFRYGAHYVRNVSAQGANRRVLVDEMRIISSGGEWAGTVANVSRLVVELRTTSHGYQIARYYHESEDPNFVGKYEGFVAE